MFLCGLELDISDGDASTASLQGNFFYPRTLVAAGQDLDGDGQASPAISCSDPIDCVNKCRLLERTSLHGAGAPPTCAMYAPSNLHSSTSLVFLPQHCVCAQLRLALLEQRVDDDH